MLPTISIWGHPFEEKKVAAFESNHKKQPITELRKAGYFQDFFASQGVIVKKLRNCWE